MELGELLDDVVAERGDAALARGVGADQRDPPQVGAAAVKLEDRLTSAPARALGLVETAS
jgi:hypothetical protein